VANSPKCTDELSG